MSTPSFIKVLLITLVFSYEQVFSNPIKNNGNKDTLLNLHINEIVFGLYCLGSGTYHVNYRYSTNTNFLFIEHYSYLKREWESEPVTDKNKIATTAGIIKNIPKELLTTTKTKNIFGCPDCTDGCGIYFQIKQDTIIKKFDIDYHTSDLPDYIRQFTEYLKIILKMFEENAK